MTFTFTEVRRDAASVTWRVEQTMPMPTAAAIRQAIADAHAAVHHDVMLQFAYGDTRAPRPLVEVRPQTLARMTTPTPVLTLRPRR